MKEPCQICGRKTNHQPCIICRTLDHYDERDFRERNRQEAELTDESLWSMSGFFRTATIRDMARDT